MHPLSPINRLSAALEGGTHILDPDRVEGHASPTLPTRNASGYFAGPTRDTFLLAFTSLFADISTQMLYLILPNLPDSGVARSLSAVRLVEGVAIGTNFDLLLQRILRAA